MSSVSVTPLALDQRSGGPQGTRLGKRNLTLRKVVNGFPGLFPNGNFVPQEMITQTPPVVKKRVPTCAKCRNHGILVESKGHKKECPFQPCRCQRCELTARRRLVMKMQVSLRRSQSSQIERQAKVMARLQASAMKTTGAPSEDSIADTSLSSESSESSAISSESLTESPTSGDTGTVAVPLATVDPSRIAVSAATADIAAQLVKLFPPTPNSPNYVQMRPYFDCIAAFVDGRPPGYMQTFLACLGCSVQASPYPQQVLTSSVLPKPQLHHGQWQGVAVSGTSSWPVTGGTPFFGGLPSPGCGAVSTAQPLTSCDMQNIGVNRALENGSTYVIKELDDAATALVDLAGNVSPTTNSTPDASRSAECAPTSTSVSSQGQGAATAASD